MRDHVSRIASLSFAALASVLVIAHATAGSAEGAASSTVIPVPESSYFTRNNSGLPTDQVAALAVTPDGALLVGTEGFGLHSLQGAHWRTIYAHQAANHDANRIRHITVGPTGDLWVGSARGLLHRTGGAWEFFEQGDRGLPGNYVSTVSVARDGTIWVGTDRGVARLRDGQWSAFTASSSALPGNQVHDIAIGPDGTVWIGTDRGLASVKGDTWKVYTSDTTPLPDDNVTAVTVGRDGTTWVGTQRGLARLAAGKWTVYTASTHALPDGHVTALLLSGDETLWVGTAGGLARLHRGAWTYFEIPPKGARHRSITALSFAPRTRQMWVGTWHGLVSVAADGPYAPPGSTKHTRDS